MNIATALTWTRIALVPLFVLAFYLPFNFSHLVTAGIFAFAAATDWLDGYLARSLEQATRFGAFLDPVADKLVVITALVLLVGKFPLTTIPVAIIIGREIVVSSLREWMAEIGKRASIAVTSIAKIKTAIQMLAIIVLLAYMPRIMPEIILIVGYALLYIAAALTLWTMYMYLKVARPDLMQG